MHSQKVIHRDLKLGNLLLDDRLTVKLCDFGLAARLISDSDRKTTICGTPNYLAPEILQGSKNGGHSYAVDIWSIGVILFTMLCGRPPFESKSVSSTYKRIRNVDFAFPKDVSLSKDARSLISSILRSSAHERPTILQLQSHPFFTENVPQTLPLSILRRSPTPRELGLSLDSPLGNPFLLCLASPHITQVFKQIKGDPLKRSETHWKE